MEKRVAKKVDDYIHNFKQEIKELIISLNIHQANGGKILLQSILDKPNLSLTQEDFIKRQRAKNIVNSQDRCTAKRASGELCSRKKKKDTPFCGTHCKGIPYGCVDDASQHTNNIFNNSTSCNQFPSQKINIYTTDIQGIIYYIDDKKNAYSMEDVMNSVDNPHIIGHVSIDNIFTPTHTISPLHIPPQSSSI
jgi:hypothetical protein